MTPSPNEWETQFLKIHYEPEHEKGQTCWCKPITLVKERVPHIEHNEQRVILIDFIREQRRLAREQGRNEAVDYITSCFEGRRLYDVDETQIIDAMSDGHFADFMKFFVEAGVQSERTRIREGIERLKTEEHTRDKCFKSDWYEGCPRDIESGIIEAVLKVLEAKEGDKNT